VLLGSATRLAKFLVGLDKRYVTAIDLSVRTSTGDREGEPLGRHEAPTRMELDRRLDELRGEIELLVPAASAVKIGGRRAYSLARSGVTVEMPLRRSTVHALTLVEYDGRVAQLELLVSSGTYVRAIAEALAGHCVSLRRTAVGPFAVERADPDRILPAAEALPFLPLIEVDADEARAIRSGRTRVREPVRIVHDGELVAADGTVLP
jgi:tRNA pseudouridine55 synthase